jgi:(1->4)-alpha-D-glucan 1-alpha-D-glucosylmutase
MLAERHRQLRAPREWKGIIPDVEKILDLTRESLPLNWPVHGTTGYEFANQMVQILRSERGKANDKDIRELYRVA